MTNTVAGLVVDSLIANGIDQLYCLPGVQNDDFFDALYDRRNILNPVHTRHEQGAAYMALGAALATGKPQAFSIVPGPGFLNGCAALATAYSLNAPLLALVGQIPSRAIGKGFGLLHEIPDQLAILRGLTKHAERIVDGKNAAALLNSAFSQLTDGRPGPVGIEVPVDVWKLPVVDPLHQQNAGGVSPAPDPARLHEAATLLASADRPLIVVGGGAQDCSVEITRLAETLSAPVMAFRTGHGVVSSHNRLSVNAPVGHRLWQDCDVVIGIGTRLQTQQMQWGVDDAMKIIHIDINPAEIGRINTPAVGICADAADAIPALLDALHPDMANRSNWLNTVDQAKANFASLCQEKLGPQLSWINAIRAELPDNGIFVDELTQIGYVSRFAFPTYKPRTFLSTGYQGTLGWGFATALGAAHARRDVPVVSISGDGGALFTIGEMATAVRHKIPLTLIVFNDNAFGNVRRFQIENYNNRPIASDLTSPDFVKLAESFGARGMRATSPEELRRHLALAIKSDGPTLIEVPVGDFPSPWEFIMMPKVRGV